MNPLSYGLLRHVGALALADMSVSGKAATCRRSPKAFWLLLSLLLLLTTSLRAEFEPPLIKVMEKADIFGEEPFEGDVSVNAQGQWIAASQNGVFLRQANTQGWQEVLTATGQKIVSANTITIQCRISDSGSWVVINRSGIYKNSDADFYTADTVSSSIGINHVYDLDMAPNGKWIASSSQGTWRFLNDGNPASLVLSSGSVGNGALSAIVKINSSGDWVIMTSSGVFKTPCKCSQIPLVPTSAVTLLTGLST